jgi:hypothetical protein
MARRDGGLCAFLANSVAVSALHGWTYTDTDVNVNATAAGDVWEDNNSLRGKFVVEADAFLDVANPYVIPNALRGTKVAFVCKVLTADTNGIVSGTMLVDEFRIEAAFDDMIKIHIRGITAGVAPTWDLSPAT